MNAQGQPWQQIKATLWCNFNPEPKGKVMGKNQGIKSRNVTHPSYHGGKAPHGKSVKATSQIGSQMANKVMEHERLLRNVADKMDKGAFDGAVPMGNAIAEGTVCGPGGSRNVSKAGSQGSH
jgi:hypothetical protein